MKKVVAFLFLLTISACSQELEADLRVLHDAQIAFSAGRFEDAGAKFQSLLNSDANHHTARAWLIRTYLQQEKVKLAVQAAVDAPAGALQHSGFLTARGETEFRRGRIKESELSFLAAIKLPDPDARAFLGLAKIYDAISMRARAKIMSDRARAILAASGASAQVDAQQSTDRSEAAYPCTLAKSEPVEADLWPMFSGAVVTGYGLELGVNGKKAVLQVDTGASRILVSRKFASKAGIKRLFDSTVEGIGDEGPSKGYVGVADSITLSGVEFRKCLVQVVDNKHVFDGHGLLGTDLFEKFLITLDFPARKFRLGPLPQRPDSSVETREFNRYTDRYIAPEMQSWEKVFRFGHHLLIWTRVNESEPKLFLIDTGSFINLISPEALATDPVKERYISGLSGRVNEVRIAAKADLKFAGFRLPGRDVTAIDLSRQSSWLGTEVSGILGHDLLRQTQLSIDYRDGLVKIDYDPARLR